MSLSETVGKFIEKEELFSTDDKLLVGVSGGMDSMAMLDLLRKGHSDLTVAHVNFKLRGDDSDQDARLVEDYCSHHNISFELYEVSSVEVTDLKAGNLQEKARTLRYNWFQTLLEKHDCQYICIAHHREDVVETYFLHALRASGLQGMQSIQPKSGLIRRPLLSASQDSIRAYIQKHNIPYREDRSNNDEVYDRNFIRNNLIKTLKVRWPHLSNSIYNSARHLSQEYDLLSALMSQQLAPYITQHNDTIKLGPLAELTDLTSHLGTLLYHHLKTYAFNKDQVDDIVARRKTSGRRWYSPTHQISIKDDVIYIRPKEATEVMMTIEGPGAYAFPTGILELKIIDRRDLVQQADIEHMDLSYVKWPLMCRTWQPGDKMTPLGMSGRSKLVSDMLIDKKVHVLQKMDQLVLVDKEEQIIWLVQQRLSDSVKYDDQTERLLRLEWKPKKENDFLKNS